MFIVAFEALRSLGGLTILKPSMNIKKSLLLLPLLALPLVQCSEAKESQSTEEKKTSETVTKKKTVKLFDGKTLDGWKTVVPANAKYWSVVDGVITASNGSEKMPTNTYIATEKSYEDFQFICKFRLTGDHASGFINSGIQYRSLLEHGRIVGYQADIGRKYWGDIHDEHRRNNLMKGDLKALFEDDFKEDEWGTYKIVCKGDSHKLYINDHLVADYTEKDTNIPKKGVIALQIHSGGVAKMEYKDIYIQEL
mgnify:CR=1 FL=1